MDKTPISIALERQIPEFIREEYGMFVEFLKAYYAFLDQTQQRNLEDIRSIENTLDEFILRFKKELSVVFPTNTLTNERFILQHIREFYKTRGSNESFQFLFRALFNKEAEIYYPSKQILRASDGSWIQEKSVFIRASTEDIFKLGGKIVTIKTAMKHIHVFSPRVVYYRENIYEVFIDRSYTADISIGDTVTSEDNTISGTIIPCPSKYTIVSNGAGFEIGALYHLPSESGNGSLVKITKIDSIGGIKKIQVISFGLDYQSVFYAKLSNKTRQAFAYYNPITSFTLGAGHPAGLYPTASYSNSNPYSDGTTGYIDIGYINTQNYFAYDSAYLPSGNTNEKVFYADGTYVGEIIGSFYTNNSNAAVVDNTMAEIRIELGPVAIYPGYYSKSDGFISDESFIQDGKYYQLFSYVIKVEQQVDSYRDIIKALLHPAGFEMFAEYNIKNTYLVSASPLNAYIRRQFTEQQYITDDDAANEIYKFLSDIQISYHSDIDDIKNVAKPIADIQTTIESKYYDMLKGSAENPVENSLVPAYHISTQDIKNSTRLSVDASTIYHIDSSDIKVNLKGSAENPVENSLAPAYHIDSSDIKVNLKGSAENPVEKSIAGGYHIANNDIKDMAPVYADTPTPIEVLNRTVIYNRAIIPLATDSTNGNDLYGSLWSPSAYSEVSNAVGGDWSWNGSAYIQNYPETRIGVGYIRTPNLIGFQAILVAGSNVVTLTSGSTAGMYNGLALLVSSGAGAFGVFSRILTVINTVSFTTTVNHATSGSVVFNTIGDTPQLGELVSSPTDIFPDGSSQGLVKFAFSGTSWNQIASTGDAFASSTIYNRSIIPLAMDSTNTLDVFPDGSSQGLVKFAFSGASWADITIPGDSIPLRSSINAYADVINNTNPGTLYFNVYNQNDAADPNSSYSYETEGYSVHDTRAIS